MELVPHVSYEVAVKDDMENAFSFFSTQGARVFSLVPFVVRILSVKVQMYLLPNRGFSFIRS